MSKLTKKAKLTAEILPTNDVRDFSVAIDALKEIAKKSKIKFIESVDLAINLGVDARKGDQMVRGMLSLPVSSGKDVRIAVFAEGEDGKKALENGAVKSGMQDLADSMQKGECDYDVVIAVPEAMKLVGQLGRVLGPKGLMPNPKDGTVSKDVAAAVAKAKSGQVRLRNDKQGIVHCSLGKLDTKTADLEKNFIAIMDEIKRLKPKTSKGTYLQKITVSSTMGPGVVVNVPAG